ncbi:hypothetical protein ASPZODRAFT_56383 [Penicilliopsis zonata CBS 506.65]|uniref:SCD domain-containing protein n=1 Tax=Penicilliopsis zonata CBS 506.65 TaxID=1073090 RepID=A0A1L9SVF6_9EURO|nr:hypothetical protein ASPZODRAFT_56383 [Penicilliopsis zonata CBS 506.65]OJJ51195.1 hypothetical protein ASPZODRAFT_56383 [Penicilliopsis zonata CBS 506.65]
MAESRSSSPLAATSQEPASSPAADRRKSGRVSRKPQLFSQEGHGSRAKRKRDGDDDDDNDDDNEDGDVDEEGPDALDEESEEEEDDEPDEEELREKQRSGRRMANRKAPAGSRAKPKAHTAKKPRVAGNGARRQLALRPAVSRPRKRAAKFSFAAEVGGLYAEVFAKGQTVDAVAAEWLTQYQRNKAEGLCDLVNFILRCTGSTDEVSTADIEDVDHIPQSIKDLQDDYQEQGISEYPLISKSKSLRSFQPVLQDFFTALTQTLHHSSTLYTDGDLFENFQTWVAGLSTAGCRPFRHTATLISLTVTTALCALAREVTTTISTSRKQLESEKKKKTANKGRAAAIQTAIQEGENKLEIIDALLKDSFDTVFVHRYRDVDAKIRAECMSSLGQWLRTYREFFFEGQYLRYLGWVLSDTSAQARLIVVAELKILFENKDNIAGLNSFTERFRPRLVEMATRDADVSVRASAVELLDLIRDAGMIEPADIDTVGRLVFDLEPRVRKAAGRFFVANVEDVFESTTEEVGEEMNEIFGDEDEEDTESPKRSWIKFKCLADILQAYDEQENELKPERSAMASRDVLSGSSIDSRFVLATEAIYPHLEELSQWQSLAGYLLYDHSQIPVEPAEDDTTGTVKNMYRMQEGHELILLEVLGCAVKLRILDVAKSDVDRRGRRAKGLTEKITEQQEEIAHGLAQIIPQLLNKFGSSPEAASAVLRLEHLVDLDKIQDMQKDVTAYSSLLNDINKQFLTHSDQDVLAEATIAFLHAKSSDELKEALENKIQELWDDMVDTLSALVHMKDQDSDDEIPESALTDLSNTVMRISKLASVIDCTTILETVPSSRSKAKKARLEAPFNTLIHLAKRGIRSKQAIQDTAQQERDIVVNSIRSLLFYFMWKVQALSAALNSGKALNTAYFEAITKSRETFVATLISIMQERSGLDEERFAAITALLDLQTLFGTLRHAGQNSDNDQDTLLQTQSLVHEIGSDTQTLIARIHGVAERIYAKKVGRYLEPADDDAPTSESEDDEQASNDEDPAVVNERLRSTIVAEQRLCELTGKIVLAMIGRVIDASGAQRGKLRERLLKNKSRLGHNYREVLAFLTDSKPANSSTSRSKAKQRQQKQAKSVERIEDDDEDEEIEAHHGEEDDEDDLRARELVDDPIEDENDAPPRTPESDEDEIMGD